MTPPPQKKKIIELYNKTALGDCELNKQVPWDLEEAGLLEY